MLKRLNLRVVTKNIAKMFKKVQKKLIIAEDSPRNDFTRTKLKVSTTVKCPKRRRKTKVFSVTQKIEQKSKILTKERSLLKKYWRKVQKISEES